MLSDRLLSPITAALNIREEYHKDVEKRLRSIDALGDETLNQIVTDVYAKDDIYFSLNRSYEYINLSFADFCKEQGLHYSLVDRCFPEFGRKKLYKHQAGAIESIYKGQTTIISTGTGSGKTESFLIPILHHCLVQEGIRGIKAIILYPLNALANDQVRRILKAVKSTNIRVGCFVGSTPQKKERTPSDCEEQYISREEIEDGLPDILITNYIMLDRLITKSQHRSMFERSADTLKYIVVDEIHYFRGTKGANLSLLLKRLRLLYKQPPVQIGASGTLRRGGGYFPDSEQDSIERFARLIFGDEAITKNGFQLIEPIFGDLETPKGGEVLPLCDVIEDLPLSPKLDKDMAKRLYQQISGKPLERQPINKLDLENNPIYKFVLQSPFILAIHKKLAEGICTFSDFVDLYGQLYQEAYGREPQNSRAVVKMYCWLIDYLNYRCEVTKEPPVLDYRLHIILGNVGEALTRCLLCSRYHDGRCPRCRYCGNGLLFRVSKKHPELCIAYLAGQELFPSPPSGRRHFAVLVQVSYEQAQLSNKPLPHVQLELKPDTLTEEESYLLRSVDKDGVVISMQLPEKQALEELLLSEPRLYWHNVLKVIDALVVDSEKHITDKLLGFIDNRERASSIKLRLNDEIADRTLSALAIEEWSSEEGIDLLEAFRRLENKALSASSSDEDDDTNNAASGPLKEMPFWFMRMLSYLDEYENWEVSLRPSAYSPDEHALLSLMLNEGAIDRTSFRKDHTDTLRKHFSLESYRVSTEYGVGLSVTNERGYNIKSLGEHGRDYKEFITKVGSATIQELLINLTSNGVLVHKKTPQDVSFYQLCPEYLLIKTREKSGKSWTNEFATVECHTADHSSESRAEIEVRFSDAKIQALICTPTLEMGVDIGKLSSVLMIGFPPSPANYAQRAGRAGRSAKSRQATIVVLSSSEDPHDEYYYAIPQHMIDGEVTPPRFTLTNFALLAKHVYAHLAAKEEDLSFLCDPLRLENHIRSFLEHDELQLQNELGEVYAQFGKYLAKDSQLQAKELKGRMAPSIEKGYRLGILPDYGFRSDGLPLVRRSKTAQEREEDDDTLTSRDPEEAPRKLAPGRIVFCGGRAVKVDKNQPEETYRLENDPANKPYRLYRHVVANEEDEVHIEKYRDPESLYRMSRFLDVKKPLEALEMHGPLYCRVYFVDQGSLFFVNEGKLQRKNKLIEPLSDHKGDYRFGTYLERNGLLIRFADHILPPNMKVNFLAALLRGIPSCFDLDDSELRVVQNVQLYPDSEVYKGTNFFIYGHDESGLVPFRRIFEYIEEVLEKTLSTLESCSSCESGCYLCLFSLNSRVLTGSISRQEAKNCISVFLRRSLLKPHIAPPESVMIQPDSVLTLVVNANQCQIIIQNATTEKPIVRNNADEDYNTRIYLALQEALEREWSKGARTVKIFTRIEHVRKQLLGENDIDNGREAFLALQLMLLKWQKWEIERG